MDNSRATLIVVLCAIYSLLAGLYPFKLAVATPVLDREFPWGFVTAFAVPIGSVRANDILQNIVYFLPWGMACYVVLGSPRRRPWFLIVMAVLIGGSVSLAIEFFQIFFLRHPSVYDLLANAFGAVLGALICAISPIDGRKIAARLFDSMVQSRVWWSVVVLYGAIPLMVSMTYISRFDFRSWNRDSPSLLADERPSDTPWPGTLDFVAVYDRALPLKEIARYNRRGASSNGFRRRVSRGLVASYTFGESPGLESRNDPDPGSPLNLIWHPSVQFRRLPNQQGIQIFHTANVKKEGSAGRLFDAHRFRGELSLETWMTPAIAAQNGNAQIVSVSSGLASWNLVAGQVGADIDFGVQTPISGMKGEADNLRARNGFVSEKQYHVVTTYKDGLIKLYVDGQEHPDNIDIKKKEDVIIAFSRNKMPSLKSLIRFFWRRGAPGTQLH